MNKTHFFEKSFWIVLFGVFFPRLCVLGSYPYMDEGYYIFQAQCIAESLFRFGHLPDYGHINLYSLLLAPFTRFSANIFVVERLCDLCFALLSGYLFCHILRKECGNDPHWKWIALLLLLGLNSSEYIEAGAKNSFFAAFVPLLFAYCLAQKGKRWNFFWAGAFTAIAVLLREPFALYAFIGFFSIWIGYGFIASVLYSVGGIVCGSGIIALVVFARGGFTSLLHSYIGAATVMGAESNHIFEHFLHYGWRSFYLSFPLLFFALVAVFFLIRTRQTLSHRKKVYFYLALIVAPLFEILGKIGFSYHFSLMLPGFAGLLALGCCVFREQLQRAARIIPIVGVAAVLGMAFLNVNVAALPQSLSVIRATPLFSWPKDASLESNTLFAAQKIRELGGKTLAVNGFMYFLYPSSGLLPPSIAMEDLSRLYLRKQKDADAVKSLLEKNPPDIIALAKTVDADHVAMFTDELESILAATKLYRRVFEIPVDSKKNYGWIGCTLYQRIRPTP